MHSHYQDRRNYGKTEGGVLILVVMEDALALLSFGTFANVFLPVLILVVMEDALAHKICYPAFITDSVLILVVMEDALALKDGN